MLITVFGMFYTRRGPGRRQAYHRFTSRFRYGYPAAGLVVAPTRSPSITQPTPQRLTATHMDCNNFRNGFCTLYNVVVDPTGAACPSFTPKHPNPTWSLSAQTPLTADYHKIQALQDLIKPLERQLDQIKKEIEQLKKPTKLTPPISGSAYH